MVIIYTDHINHYGLLDKAEWRYTLDKTILKSVCYNVDYIPEGLCKEKNQQGYDLSRLFVLPEINKKKIVKNTFCFFQIEQIRETLIGKNTTSSKKIVKKI